MRVVGCQPGVRCLARLAVGARNSPDCCGAAVHESVIEPAITAQQWGDAMQDLGPVARQAGSTRLSWASSSVVGCLATWLPATRVSPCAALGIAVGLVLLIMTQSS